MSCDESGGKRLFRMDGKHRGDDPNPFFAFLQSGIIPGCWFLKDVPAGRTALQTMKRFVLVHLELWRVKAAGLAQILRRKGSLESRAENLKEGAVNAVISQGNGFVFRAVEISAPCDEEAKILSHAQV